MTSTNDKLLPCPILCILLREFGGGIPEDITSDAAAIKHFEDNATETLKGFRSIADEIKRETSAPVHAPVGEVGDDAINAWEYLLGEICARNMDEEIHEGTIDTINKALRTGHLKDASGLVLALNACRKFQVGDELDRIIDPALKQYQESGE